MKHINCKKINRDTIKYIAIFAMLLNHIAHFFLKDNSVSYLILINIGYFTAITMCFFLVEGYKYTRSVKKYALRLLIFAIISQIPYYIAFRCVQFNIMFTLLFCLAFLWTKDNVSNIYLKYTIFAVLILLSTYSDWSVCAIFFVHFFYEATNNHEELKKAWANNLVLIFVFHMITYMNRYSMIDCIFLSVISLIAPIIAAIMILYLYNGKKATKFNQISKWFFYCFYPGHLLILILLKYLIV